MEVKNWYNFLKFAKNQSERQAKTNVKTLLHEMVNNTTHKHQNMVKLRTLFVTSKLSHVT